MSRVTQMCLSLLLVVLLAGCAGAADTPAEPAAEVEGTAAGEPVTVTLAYNRFLEESFGSGPPPLEVIQQAVAAEHPNITVELNLVPDAIDGHRDALVVWMTTEDGTVDIYGIDTPWVPEFGAAGWAVPLGEVLPALDERFVPTGLDIFSYEGERLGVPFWGSIGGLFYRADLLDTYGFEPPATYDDLARIAREIQADQPELSGFVWPGAREESLVQTWAEFFRGFGGDYFDDTGACAINSEEGVAAVTYMRMLIDEGISPRETSAWTSAEARTRFVEGNAVFLRHNQDLVTWLDDPERSGIAEAWGFVPNPAQPGGTSTGATGGFAFAINPFTDNLDAAVQVLDVIASEEVQKGFALAWGPVQYYDGLYRDPEVEEANPNVMIIEGVFNSAAPRPQSTSYAQLSGIIQAEVHAALTDTKPIADALNDACVRIDELQ